mmetsp:Transcript_38403/g.74483  ORF Transcript_38403/g.74483 Transcript_38403/m.74483 type:complete len:532 (+) Transcript_38403:184-1779(+)
MSSAVVTSVLMVITGSINTISTKLADITASKNIEGDTKDFNHPFFQAACMFFGELCCLIVFKLSQLRRSRPPPAERGRLQYVEITSEEHEELTPSHNWSPVIFLLPACCDLTATSLMYIGLGWTYASIFQMLRGSVMIFTGIFSIIFLGRKLGKHQWIGMVVVMAGLALVGVSSVLAPSGGEGAPNPLGGIIVIIIAQLVQATQMVVEEKFLTKYEGIEPLQAVGWEGFWGFLVLSTLLVPMYWIPGTATGGRLENALDAFVQIGNSYVVMAAILGNIVSIGFFNFFGVTVTRTISATTRMVLDSVRTLVIWIFSLMIGWEKFQYMQAIGFPFLVLGMFIYNGSIKIPGLAYPEPEKEETDVKAESWTAESGGGYEENRGRNITLEDVLKSQVGFQLFSKYCKENNSGENIGFWAAIQDYRSITDEERRLHKAQNVMNNYISSHAIHQVNLPAKLRRRIEEQMEVNDADATLYDEAQACIYGLMKRDVFPRFKASPSFDELLDILEQMEGYEHKQIGNQSGITTSVTLRVG